MFLVVFITVAFCLYSSPAVDSLDHPNQAVVSCLQGFQLFHKGFTQLQTERLAKRQQHTFVHLETRGLFHFFYFLFRDKIGLFQLCLLADW